MAPFAAETDGLYRLLVEHLGDYAVCLLDVDGRILSWNAGAHLALGYAPEEVVGRSGSILFSPEDREADVPRQELATATAAGRASDERWYLRKDGSRFFASAVVTALRGETGDLLGFAKVLRDLTERKLAEQRLKTEHAVIHV